MVGVEAEIDVLVVGGVEVEVDDDVEVEVEVDAEVEVDVLVVVGVGAEVDVLVVGGVEVEVDDVVEVPTTDGKVVVGVDMVEVGIRVMVVEDWALLKVGAPAPSVVQIRVVALGVLVEGLATEVEDCTPEVDDEKVVGIGVKILLVVVEAVLVCKLVVEIGPVVLLVVILVVLLVVSVVLGAWLVLEEVVGTAVVAESQTRRQVLDVVLKGKEEVVTNSVVNEGQFVDLVAGVVDIAVEDVVEVAALVRVDVVEVVPVVLLCVVLVVVLGAWIVTVRSVVFARSARSICLDYRNHKRNQTPRAQSSRTGILFVNIKLNYITIEYTRITTQKVPAGSWVVNDTIPVALSIAKLFPLAIPVRVNTYNKAM